MTVFQVFVYGTLKPGEINYSECSSFVVQAQPAVTYGQLYHLPLGYPALTLDGSDLVYGMVLSFTDPAVLEHLDVFEQHDLAHLQRLYPHCPPEQVQYARQSIRIATPELHPLGTAWAYVMTCTQVQQLAGIRVMSGEWSQSWVEEHPTHRSVKRDTQSGHDL